MLMSQKIVIKKKTGKKTSHSDLDKNIVSMYLKRIHSNPMFAYMTGKRQTGSDVEPKNIKQYLICIFFNRVSI